MFYELEVAGLKRKLQLYPVSDQLSIAAFIIFGDVELTKACASKLLDKAPEFDIMLTAEAKAIPLIYEMSALAGVNDYVVARKGTKVYMTDPISVGVDSITTANSQHLYLGQEDVAKLHGRRVLVVDDVISTGESLASLEELANRSGATIVGKMAILAEGDAINRPDITVLGKLPLFDSDGSVKA